MNEVRKEEPINRLVGTDFDPDVQKKFFRKQERPKPRSDFKQRVNQALTKGNFEELEEEE